ncbi:MAG: mevalonate kinase [Mangrovibacterium sp.]
MKIFFAKLLLFGEYGLMFGARALAVPFFKYSGHLIKPGEIHPDQVNIKSTVELERFVSWYNHERLNSRMNFPLDLGRLREDISKNLFFQSDIPQEYGVGSSGALCAALFHDYSVYGENLNQVGKRHSLPEVLKNDFSLMESYFHGKSSGLDPLVSFLNQTILFDSNHISLPYLRTDRLPYSVYLIDTGFPSATSPLVSRFLDKMQDPDFRAVFNRDYLPANDGAVEAFLKGQHDRLFSNIRLITRFQLDYLSEMIPQPFMEIIEQLMMQGICVKLLGSGGGGFLLAFVPEGTDAGLLRNSMKVF